MMKTKDYTNPACPQGYDSYDFKTKEDKKKFKDFALPILMMYRTTPEDKHMFVAGLKVCSSKVAVAAEAVSDALALQCATVGMAMGQGGCAAARDSSDLIILDDNFESVFTAAKWGRNIFNNVRKFIQFQLTVNISCILIVLIGSASLGMSPFSAMQLLWINLIMDVLAAIALATEAPHPTELGPRARSSGDARQILPVMYRAIYSQVLYQMIVMLTLLYAGPTMFGHPYHLVTEELRAGPTNEPTLRMRHYSFLFHTFVLMNLFNMLNCRILNGEENSARNEEDEAPKKYFNVFARMNKNWWFPIVMLAEFNI